jgi:hypothetical protein
MHTKPELHDNSSAGSDYEVCINLGTRMNIGGLYTIKIDYGRQLFSVHSRLFLSRDVGSNTSLRYRTTIYDTCTVYALQSYWKFRMKSIHYSTFRKNFS